MTSADSPLGLATGHHVIYLFIYIFVDIGGFALLSEFGAQMALKKPRPLQAASGKRNPQRMEAMHLLTGFFVKLETVKSDYGT